MSPLKTRIQDDVKEAMRARDSARLGVLRLITAEIKQREVDERKELDDEQVIAVLGRMVKQHQDSISQYRSGGRQDLVDKEAFELDIISSYLPPAMPEDELLRLIDQGISESGASSIKDMGKVMALLKSRIQGRADMTVVSARVRERLGA
ncbi:MAG: GatB/YqeY domain-containing protein [Gammaproteobacteria bacterium]|jgi:uncharacterized protein YqeY|nr:GatB/YqeY domain-containing protein [Gammaproteobacteria bacterium]